LTPPFFYRDGRLCCGESSLTEIAEQTGTPVYVYSASGILERFHAYQSALGEEPNRVCFAVKANSNLAILHLLAQAGAGFDIVSGGELYRVLQAGGDPSRVVFSGVGKTRAEMEYALSEGIHSFNCESERELEVLSAAAAGLGKTASVAIRVNPDVDASTHPYISTGLRNNKFGIEIERAETVYRHAANLPGIRPESISCHIGSQILDATPVFEAVGKVVELARRLLHLGLPIRSLDLGGGLGVAYRPEQSAPPIAEFVTRLREAVAPLNLAILLEPGRSIVAECGALVTRVIFRKRSAAKEFVIVDAAMNDLLRPALYSAHHEILPLDQSSPNPRILADVVGPVCETGDFLARDREMAAVEEGDLAAILTAGAYGFVLSSNYNSRPRAAEVLVEASGWRVVRDRETLTDLIRGERA
jgi:diaminopimelate decarboxylase